MCYRVHYNVVPLALVVDDWTELFHTFLLVEIEFKVSERGIGIWIELFTDHTFLLV